MTSEALLLTSSTSAPPPPNGKDNAASDEYNEKTEIMYSVEYIIDRTLQTLSTVKYRFDNCGDIMHPSTIVTTEPVRKAFLDVKNRGVKTRFILKLLKIIYITARSLCKLSVRFVTLRELKEISQ